MKKSKEEVLRIARNAYEVCRAFEMSAIGHYVEPFEELSPEEKALTCIAVHLTLEDKKKTPKKIHETFIEELLDSGWVYGEKFDLDKKTDPRLIAYPSLPKIVKAKDRLFYTTVLIGEV